MYEHLPAKMDPSREAYGQLGITPLLTSNKLSSHESP